MLGGGHPTVWIKIVVLGHCPAVQKKSPGAPRALPLEQKLAGIALAEQSS
jgi:hypothetical protein